MKSYFATLFGITLAALAVVGDQKQDEIENKNGIQVKPSPNNPIKTSRSPKGWNRQGRGGDKGVVIIPSGGEGHGRILPKIYLTAGVATASKIKGGGGGGSGGGWGNGGGGNGGGGNGWGGNGNIGNGIGGGWGGGIGNGIGGGWGNGAGGIGGGWGNGAGGLGGGWGSGAGGLGGWGGNGIGGGGGWGGIGGGGLGGFGGWGPPPGWGSGSSGSSGSSQCEDKKASKAKSKAAKKKAKAKKKAMKKGGGWGQGGGDSGGWGQGGGGQGQGGWGNGGSVGGGWGGSGGGLAGKGGQWGQGQGGKVGGGSGWGSGSLGGGGNGLGGGWRRFEVDVGDDNEVESGETSQEENWPDTPPRKSRLDDTPQQKYDLLESFPYYLNIGLDGLQSLSLEKKSRDLISSSKVTGTLIPASIIEKSIQSQYPQTKDAASASESSKSLTLPDSLQLKLICTEEKENSRAPNCYYVPI